MNRVPAAFLIVAVGPGRSASVGLVGVGPPPATVLIVFAACCADAGSVAASTNRASPIAAKARDARFFEIGTNGWLHPNRWVKVTEILQGSMVNRARSRRSVGTGEGTLNGKRGVASAASQNPGRSSVISDFIVRRMACQCAEICTQTASSPARKC